MYVRVSKKNMMSKDEQLGAVYICIHLYNVYISGAVDSLYVELDKVTAFGCNMG
jgi:hypothetical protein